jgi:ribosomal protein L37AE/L43A
MNKKIIKCSQCKEEFSGGYEYRMHWEVHLDQYLERERDARMGK